MTTITGHTTRANGTILTAAIYNADHVNHISNAQALNTGKIEGATPPVVDGHAVVFDGTGGNQIRSASAAPVLTTETRERLTANRTYYVRTDGNDSNSGLVDSAGGAFLTPQKAIDVAYKDIDVAEFSVDIQIRDGTYGGISVAGGPHLGQGGITVKGNAATPGNVILTTTGLGQDNGTVAVRDGAKLNIQDLEIRSVTSGHGIYCRSAGHVRFSNIRFGTIVNAQIVATQGGYVVATGNYSIVGGAQQHIWANADSEVRVQSRTITLTGTPAFSVTFIQSDYGGIATLNGNTWTGSATGKRFDASNNGVVVGLGGLTEFPGNAAGTVSKGGVHSSVQSDFTSIISQIFTSSGTYTPTAGMKYCRVTVTGAGGGGGGADNLDGTASTGGGGGGAGATCIRWFTAAEIGASQSVTIGAAGTAGAATGTTGGTGGTSSLGSLISCAGGVGGPGAADANSVGVSGGAGAASPGVSGAVNLAGGGGGPGMGIPSIAGIGGQGGSSYWGGGGKGSSADDGVVVTGDPGVANGSGGGGGAARNNTTGAAGGTGAVGRIVIEEFI